MDERAITAKNIASHFDESASTFPDHPAVIYPSSSKLGTSTKTISFRQLQLRSLSYAEQLKEGGLSPGDRVLMMVPPSEDLLASVYALFRLRAIPVFIDPGMKRQHLLSCIERSKPKHILGVPKAHWISRLFPKAFSSVTSRFSVGPMRRWAFAKSLHSSSPKTTEPNDSLPDEEELAAILFTSGSTGPPKGVQYRVRHFHAQITMLKTHFNVTPGHLDLPLLPVFALFNPSLGMGSVIPRINPSAPASLNPEHIVDLIQRFKIQHSFGAPVLWKKIARHLEAKKLSLDSLQRILMAGAPVPPALLSKMINLTPNAEVLTPYGATEGLPLCLMDGQTIIEETAALSQIGRGICVGKPLNGIQIRIHALESQSSESVVPSGEIGEILVSGPVVTDTYDALPEATQASKHYDQQVMWHKMGDAGYLDDYGRLWFCGRVGHIVYDKKTPLFSVCVEAHFNEHPMVERSALIEVTRNETSFPAIAIELIDPSDTPNEQFKNELEGIAQHHGLDMIEEFYIHPSFPVDVRHNAKIHRKELGTWAEKELPL